LNHQGFLFSFGLFHGFHECKIFYLTRDPWLNRNIKFLPFDQTFTAKWIIGAAISYTFLQRITITIGANSLFDTYPDKISYTHLTNNGTTPYSRLATQFGFNGASYYANLNVKF
jgi:hypothetical protein